ISSRGAGATWLHLVAIAIAGVLVVPVAWRAGLACHGHGRCRAGNLLAGSIVEDRSELLRTGAVPQHVELRDPLDNRDAGSFSALGGRLAVDENFQETRHVALAADLWGEGCGVARALALLCGSRPIERDLDVACCRGSHGD